MAAWLPHACLVGGFLLALLGVGLLSVPWALILGGLTLFVSGGLTLRLLASERPPRR